MISNLERYKNDLSALIATGDALLNGIKRYAYRSEFDKEVEKQLGEGAEEFLKAVPDFKSEYQAWYSEALMTM